jgi:hypothetical protein
MRWTFAALLTLGLSACGYGVSGGAAADVSAGSTTGLSFHGTVHSGSSAIGGANLTVFAVTAGPGQEPQMIAQSVSDASGAFELAGGCSSSSPSTTWVYITASGGQAQTGNNSQGASNTAIELVAMLGTCANVPAVVTVNELTTIAAAYALNAFITGETIAGSAPGLPNAVATAAQLVDPRSGAVGASLPTGQACTATAPPLNCEALGKLNSLANALAACTASASSSAPGCAALLACATADAIDNGAGSCTTPGAVTLPTTTWEAILSIAHNPGLVSASGLFSIAGASIVYRPAASMAPNDWALAVTYTGGGLSEPTALAIDGSGNVWLANYNNAVSEFSPTGSPLSPDSGFTAGGLEESFALAIDAAGHVWVCNEQSSNAVNSGLGTLTELAADGSVLSGANGFAGGGIDFPVAILPDAAGHLWITNFGNSTLTEFGADGAALSPDSGFGGGGLSFPVGLSIDASDNVWVANQGANQISAFSFTGAVLSPSTGFTGGGLDVPQGIAADANGHVWVSNYFGASVSEFNHQGMPLSPAGGYGGGGLATPAAIAIDGVGHVWVANYDTASVSELAGAHSSAPGSALSPATGFTAQALLQPFMVAIDPSGNLWVSNFGNNTVTEFIGIAAPVGTPMIGVPRAP